jgi:methionyl aminopeptidase
VIPRRSSAELATMRRAGRVVAEMHEAIRDVLRPGVTTGFLDHVAKHVLDRRGATSNFLGYHGFPAVICASVNDAVLHGIPGDQVLDEGDLISIDCGAVVDGWHGDAAFTAGVGTLDEAGRQLIAAAEAALQTALSTMADGIRLGDLCHAIECSIDRSGFGLVREYCGHGIGRAMHEKPDVPNHGRPGRGPTLGVGNVLAIEPMVVEGGERVRTLADGWTVVTVDGGRGAHVEHTIALTDHGPEILTRL